MNIYDIAKKAGVSIATVSRAINNSGYVGKATRQKILTVIQDENYYPSRTAQNLSNGAPLKLVGIVCYNIEDMYYTKAVAVLERELSICGYDIILSCTGESRQQMQKSVDMLITKKADAIIFIGSVFAGKSESVIQNAAKHLPVFIINAQVYGKNIHCAYCDESLTIRECVKHLFNLGRQKLLFVYDVDTYGSNKKLCGFNSAVREFCISNSSVIKCGADLNIISQVIQKHLSENDTDSVICANDLLAAAALTAAAKLGIAVPEKLSVIGYNNSLIACCTSPRLTSLENNVQKLAEFTAKNINSYFTDGKAQTDYKTDFKLIIRET
ncbi:MAG: LacI family DNA-binding transcriptional regulator [Clostridia bacterium]|nr:LacI family DNA-binding transcriptional regulator [Clostridia bacterium]